MAGHTESEFDTDVIQEFHESWYFHINDGGRVCLDGTTDVYGHLDPELISYRKEEPGLESSRVRESQTRIPRSH